jgi:hypothetical protein
MREKNHSSISQYWQRQTLLCKRLLREETGNTKGGSITVPLTSCLTGLVYSVLQIQTKNVSCRTGDSKPVKQEVNGINGTVILPPLVFPGGEQAKVSH